MPQKPAHRAAATPIDVSALSPRQNMMLEFALSGLRSAVGEDDHDVKEVWQQMAGDALTVKDVDALAARFGFSN